MSSDEANVEKKIQFEPRIFNKILALIPCDKLASLTLWNEVYPLEVPEAVHTGIVIFVLDLSSDVVKADPTIEQDIVPSLSNFRNLVELEIQGIGWYWSQPTEAELDLQMILGSWNSTTKTRNLVLGIWARPSIQAKSHTLELVRRIGEIVETQLQYPGANFSIY